jgi:hypothetical protein
VPELQQARRLDMLALALTPILIVLQGHRFGVGNHELLLASIRRMVDKGYLAADWALSTAPHHPQLLQVVALLEPALGENALFLALHLITRLLLLMGAWRLALALVPGRLDVAVAAMLATFLEPRLRVGSHYLQGGHWEPAFLGMAAALWTLALGIRYLRGEGHWLPAAAAAGGGIFAHLFIGGPMLLVMLVAGLLVRRDRSLLWYLMVAVATGMPSWVPALVGFLRPDGDALSAAQLITLLQLRHPHHHQPWTWPWSHFLSLALATVVAGVVLYRRLRSDNHVGLIVVGLLAGWLVVSCTTFAIAGWLQVLPIVAYLQPFRLTSLLLWLFALSLAWVTIDVTAPLGRAGAMICALGLMALFRLEPVLATPLLASFVLVGVRQIRASSPALNQLPNHRWLWAAALPGFAALWALQEVPPLRDFANRVRREHWLVEVAPRDPERRELAQWVRQNTPTHALFAIPPAMEAFRLWEQRAIVVDWKYVPYRAPDLAEWAERIALGANIDPFHPFEVPPREDAPPDQIALLATSYGARYIVVREVVDSPAMVFRNGSFTVIDLDRADRLNLLGRPPR